MQLETMFAGLLGGILIGAAASGLVLINGRIAGISGIVGALLPPSDADVGWRCAFVAGLLAGGFLLMLLHPVAFSVRPPGSLPMLAEAALLVGFGTGIGNGCTSGHGVCGLARRSARSPISGDYLHGHRSRHCVLDQSCIALIRS